MATRVCRYDLHPPTVNGDLVRTQMRAAHTYRNVLTEIERGRRAAIREVVADIGDVPGLQAAAENARTDEDAASAALKAARTSAEKDVLRPALQAARIIRRDAVAAWREARHRIKTEPGVADALAAIKERNGEMQRSARGACEAYWGSYLLVEAAADQAREAPLYDGLAPSDPEFKRVVGEGRVGVQLQHGLAAEQLFGADRRLRIAPVDPRAWSSPVRGERRRLCRTTISLRVGSAGRDPVWATWPLSLDRPVPVGAVVKWAVVSLRRCGPRELWSVSLTVDLPDAAPIAFDDPRAEAVAVHVGWRKLDDELRAAVWLGSDGAAGELRLPAALVAKLRHPDALRATRDAGFNAARTALRAALAGLPDAPAWLGAATATLPQWHSPARLANLVRRWRTARFAGDAAAYDALEAWRYHDHHLWEWETSERRKALLQREEIGRCLAAQLATRYRALVLEEFNLCKVARRPAAGEVDPNPNETARANRQRVASGKLRDAFANAFTARGGSVLRVSGVNATQACHVCGVVQGFDAAANLRHVCADCGTAWDQDANAAINDLRRWRERWGGGGGPGTTRQEKNGSEVAEVKTSKWGKRKSEKGAKERAGGSLATPTGMASGSGAVG